METQQHVCPWWLGYTFINPLRKYQHNPDKILSPHIKPGMQVLDYGCAMGYFSLHMARMVETEGKVHCVDIQRKMLTNLERRARKAGYSNIVSSMLVGENYEPEKLKEQIDFALLFAVVHEVPDQQKLLNEIYTMLKPGGKVLFAEPPGHVKTSEFEVSVAKALKAGLTISTEKPALKKLAVILTKAI
ncbi:MAG TPA: class I SAM-dependent methyltransferase [Prolixibacteraceae bacterium]|nr:class I SAM-dependent methyltransferase [Prolixibacteraceae bacterium]HPR62087.1 class I SAM-dependent methyltransferase [Prolixibacteraceae bacterium]